MAAALLLVMASAATARPSVPSPPPTTVFTTPGCYPETIPTGDNTVAITAFGNNGSPGYNEPNTSSGPSAGGQGDGVSATVSGVSGDLYVCVDVGGGTGTSNFPGAGYGNGGGASGVSLGDDFSHPVVVAAGGGGGAGFPDGFGCGGCGSGAGGSAGYPSGTAGANGEQTEGGGEGGGGGSQTSGGGGGYDNFGGVNAPGGSCSSASGPGGGGSDNAAGGYGGAGGGGYCGGGAGAGETGGSGGGGGGSDFCNNSLVPQPPFEYGCTKFVTPLNYAAVEVNYSYSAPPAPTVYVNNGGTGQVVEVPGWGGAEAAIGGGSPTTTYGNSEYNNAAGLAVDPAGDIFTPNGSAGTINEIPPSLSETTVASGISTPNGVARDNAGDVFVATQYGVEEFVGGNPNNIQYIGSTAPGTEGVAVDAAGNVFIADTEFVPARVVEVPADGSAQRTIYGDSQTSSQGALSYPGGVAVDSAGDVFIADTYNNRVLEVTPSGTASVVASSLSYPEAVALDAYGNLYVANAGANDVVEVPAGGGTQTTVGSGLSDPSGLAVYAPPPTFTADTPPGYAPVNNSYSYTYTAQAQPYQPAPTFTLASGSLPPGLSLDPNTGALSGTPTASGAYTFQVQVGNVANATATPPTTIVTAPPTLTGVSPSAGPTSAGSLVTITGSNFAIGATKVNFGSQAATNVQVQSPTTLTALAPTGSPGTVDVTVTTAGGTTQTTSADQYTYDPAPTVTGVSPTSGPRAGGNLITITGTNFLSGATVDFGSNQATAVNVISATELTARAPAGAFGTVDVIVTTPGGPSPTSAQDHYTYGLPSVKSIAPTAGPSAGGNTVTVTGTNFVTGATVDFGATAATSVNVSSGTTLTAVAPAGTGTVDVTVTTRGGTSQTSGADRYTFGPPTVSGVNPAGGPTAGGNTVTITGTDFVAGDTVDFGATAATSVAVISPTRLTAIAPAGSGTVEVTVSNAAGPSATSNADRYGYGQPAVAAVQPRSGPGGGGQSVTITGTDFDSTATVQFGAAAATNVQLSSTTELTATAPAGTGTVDVTVTTTQGGTSTAVPGDRYTYIAPPTVSLVNPSSGSVAGGTTITIDGSHFAPGATVNVGSRGASSVNVMSPTKLTAVVPPALAGRVDVTVTTPAGGTSAPTPPDVFTYLPRAGEILAVDTGYTTGTGQLLGLFPGGPQTTLASGLANPGGVAVDGAGDVFFVQTYPANDVVEDRADGTGRTFAGGSTYPVSVAVDAQGDAFVGASAGVLEFPAGGGQITLDSGIPYSPGLAVDDHGDVFASGSQYGSSGDVIELHPNGTQTTVASGLSSPEGLAVDLKGDVFIAVSGSNQVLEVPSGGGTPTPVVSGLNAPTGVSLDAAGNMFISDGTSGGAISEAPAGGGTATPLVSNLPGAPGVAVYAPAPTLAAHTPPGYAPVGQSYSYTYTAHTPAGEPAATFALASGSLPPGLSLDPATGVLAGTPTSSGTFTFSVASENAVERTVGRANVITTVAPTITKVSPAAGPTAGGTTVTITGTGFVPGTTVAFGGGHPATNVTYKSPTTLTATAPPGTGTVNVRVSTPGGASPTSAADQYTYDPVPTVTKVSPDAGPAAGGTTVTITGSGFVPGTTVGFGGGHPATNVTYKSPTTLTAVAPAGSGTVNVRVSTAGGASPTSTADFYAYGPPTVTNVSPSSGPAAGGITVTITGSGFVPGMHVSFGVGHPATVTVISSARITAVTPAESDRTVNVQATDAAGTSTPGPGASFTFTG